MNGMRGIWLRRGKGGAFGKQQDLSKSQIHSDFSDGSGLLIR